MRRAVALLAPALLASALIFWAAVAAGRARGPEVAIVRPDVGDVAFGRITIEAEIYPPDAEVDRVEFYVDFRLVDARSRPPWRIEADVGETNTEHHVEVVAHPLVGDPVSDRVTTRAIRIDSTLDVRLRQLYVTVTEAGRRVLELGREDFRILDDKRPQRLVTFERGDVPFTAVLLLDASTSMTGGQLATAVAGARSFTGQMRPLDEAKLVLFSDRRLAETAFSNVGALFELGLTDLAAGDGTALNDALFLALQRLRLRQGRRVVVLLSDGIDVDSVLSMAQVQQVARQSQAVLYWIRIGSGAEGASHLSMWRDAAGHERELALLAETVGQSGGRVVEVAAADRIGPAFADVLAELRGQYVLGYYPEPEPAPGAWRAVEVQVGRPGVAVRSPAGYLVR